MEENKTRVHGTRQRREEKDTSAREISISAQ
jgi:hypothetical protein